MVRCDIGFSRASSLLVWLHGIILRGPHCCSHAKRTGLLHEDVACIHITAVSACRTVSELFTYFPCKYVKSHFSGRVNGLSKVHYFFTEGALAPARSSCRRCSSNSASTRHLTFAITNLLITDVATAGRDNTYPSKNRKCSKLF